MHGEKEEELLGSQENTVVSPSLSLSLSLSFFLFLLFSVFRVQSHGSSAHNRDSRATLKQKIYIQYNRYSSSKRIHIHTDTFLIIIDTYP